nr:aminoacyl-histidine dipeptidase [uncultured Dorea sp.]
MSVLNEIEPKEVFRFFEEISAIPRGSMDTKRISDYLVKFAKDRDLKVIQDEVNNVIIFQPGTEGYEDGEPVILQGHMDMVCEKTSDSDHDFKKDGLKLYVEDGYLKAKDTTLGGDDGIAVAMALALMDSNDIPHPPVEVVFTVDEELGMDGAEAIDLSVLKGKKLINIDSEEERTLTVGCAGGVRYQSLIPVEKETVSGEKIEIQIKGLLGGHSGEEIHRQRGNANKMMGRLLYHMESEAEIYLSEIYGGSKDNVIAMEAVASIVVAENDAEKIVSMIRDMEAIWNTEFMGEEPGLTVNVQTTKEKDIEVFSKDTTKRVVGFLAACPNGLQEYSRKVAGAAETSLNLGTVEMKENGVEAAFLIRSSVDSRKQQILEQVDAVTKAFGGTGTISSTYPAWQYNPDSQLRPIMEAAYKEVYKKDPEICIIHGGLECGLFLGKRPDLDCVSCGPDVLDIHSFNERLDIASTQRSWEFLKLVLKNCK